MAATAGLSGIDYLPSKADLVETWTRAGADQNAVAVREELPEGTCNSSNDVSQAVVSGTRAAGRRGCCGCSACTRVAASAFARYEWDARLSGVPWTRTQAPVRCC